MSLIDLKRCPFCGGHVALDLGQDQGWPFARVVCHSCAVMTKRYWEEQHDAPYESYIGQAMGVWNRRESSI